MHAGRLAWIPRLLRLGLTLGAAGYIALFLGLAFMRLRYPFDLEWMEGASVDHVRRVLEGRPIYVPPSLDFVPFIYTPLFYYLSAAMATLTGLSFVPLRLVSILASIACFVVIFRMVQRETGNRLAGLLAAGVFAGGYRAGGAWFDIGRSDMLMLAWVLTGLYLLRFQRAAPALIVSGLLFALGFFTKQTALIISMPVIVYLALQNRRAALLFIGSMGLPIAGGVLAWNAASGGWFAYYTLQLPGQHHLVLNLLLTFWSYYIIPHYGIALALGLLYLVERTVGGRADDGKMEGEGAHHGSMQGEGPHHGKMEGEGAHHGSMQGEGAHHGWMRGEGADGERPGFYLAAAAGLVGSAWFSKLHSGAYENVVIPAYAAISILLGLAFHRLLELIRRQPDIRQVALEAWLYTVILLQLVGMFYNPMEQRPTRRDLEAGQQLVSRLEAIHGDVLAVGNTYLATLAGKSPHAHAMAMDDIFRAKDGTLRQALNAEVSQALREQRFAALILDDPAWFHENELDRYYMRQGPVFPDETVFAPVTGMKVRPEWIYVPRPPGGTDQPAALPRPPLVSP